MYKAGLIGNYGAGTESLDGQTIKTKIVSSEVEKKLGSSNVVRKNTYGGIFFLLKMPFVVLVTLLTCQNVLIFPARNGIKVIVPVLVFWNFFFRRKIHYVVIGGWLPDFLANRPFLSRQLKKIDWIYVETEIMKKMLSVNGFNNVCVMPNFKRLAILDEKDLIDDAQVPFRFCTFSRVMKEKGIEDAVNAICQINERTKTTTCVLDIYGKVDENQQEWFNDLMKKSPKEITYKGCAPFDKSVEILKGYYALLFPTYYDGEGFAGTLLDAFAAGVPVIASDWRYNAEIIRNGIDGFVFKTSNFEEFVIKIQTSIGDCKKWNEMKRNCLSRAWQYAPQNVTKELFNHIG